MTRLSSIAVALVLFGLVCLPRLALAHEVRPAALSLEETAPGRFAVVWSPPRDSEGRQLRVVPKYPAHCRSEQRALDCGARGLDGTIQFEGLAPGMQRALVRIAFQNKVVRSYVIDPNQPVLELAGASSAAGASDLAHLFGTYTRLGVEHILSGIDHLLFVLGLLMLVGFERRLVWTVTAFTAAHSVTLGASALELVQVPTAPVEATIALSILLVAQECAKPGSTLTRRAPWAVAFAFGLLHGFGFAGALAEFGLPPNHAMLALAGFNLGVELGQLLALGVAFSIWRGVRRAPRIAKAEPFLVYAMGTAAAYWSIERISRIWLTS